jgi:hypothetical protein
MSRRLPRLDARNKIIETNGQPTFGFQRWWQDFAEKIETALDANDALDATQEAALDALEDTTNKANACYEELGPGAYAFTASATLPDDCRTAIVDTTAGAVTLTLLPVAGYLSDIVFKKTNAGANNLVIEGDGAETIDGVANVTFNAQYASRTLRPALGAWHVVASI